MIPSLPLTDEGPTDLFENAFQHAAIGMALVSLEGGFLKVNPAFCELIGQSEAEMLATDFQAITHPEDLEADLTLLQRLLAGEIPSYRMDKRYIRADGAFVWVHLTVSLVRDRSGAPRHFIAQVQDLTARREAEAAVRDSEARLRLMAEHTTDMIVVTEIGGATTYVSPSCYAITGRRPEELIGARAVDFAHPDDIGRLVAAFRGLATSSKAQRVRWRGRHKTEDRWIWLESNPALLDENHYLDVMRDVTDQVAQEEALAATTLAAEAAAQAKSEFLANMSHEIRTPLTAVIGFCGLLSARPGLDDAAAGYVARIASASEALLAIVNDVLDFSKLEAGQFSITPRAVAPVETARNILMMFEPQAAAKGLSLDFAAQGQIPEWAELDPERVRQVLINLIGNAVKFTEAGGAVSLALRYDAGRLRFEVQDTGAGLSDDQLAKLFQRFSQVDGSSTRRHGGTGLGLAICKGLADAMGGEIGVRTRVGEGSTFFFEIPAPVADAPASAPAAVESADLQAIRLLVVDDNPMNREFVRAMLSPLGVEVDEADDGESGVLAAQALPYDVILMDVRVPGLDGPGALARIRAEPGPSRFTPILAFSANGDADAPVQAGFDGVVHKPVMPQALMAELARALAWREMQAADGAEAAAR
jgi:PAS domain S-box-containing protein